MAGSLFPHSTLRSNRRRNATVDLAAWQAALATAKLRPVAKAMGVLLIAHLRISSKTRTTRKKLAATMGVAERTLARHLPQLIVAGLIQIVQHHDPKTGWHTDSTYRLTVPVAAAATSSRYPCNRSPPAYTKVSNVAQRPRRQKWLNILLSIGAYLSMGHPRIRTEQLHRTL